MSNAKTFRIKDRTQTARKLLCKDNGVEYSTKPTKEAKAIIDSFKGMSMDDMKRSAKMNHINVIIYDYDKETMIYDLQEQWYFDDSYETKSGFALHG